MFYIGQKFGLAFEKIKPEVFYQVFVEDLLEFFSNSALSYLGMDKIVFSQELLTGIKEIDEQHRELISKINNFIDGLAIYEKNKVMTELEELFDYMVQYANFHFSTEEDIMEKYSCPLREIHRMQHQYFVMEVNKLKFDMKTKGITPEFVKKVEDLLVRWVKYHISQVDMKLKECVHKGEN